MIVKQTEELYTSQASFLDGDTMPVYNPKRMEKPTFSGKQIKRGLYYVADKRLINADVNGACRILRKVASKTLGVEGVQDGKRVLAPLIIHLVWVLSSRVQSRRKQAANGSRAFEELFCTGDTILRK